MGISINDLDDDDVMVSSQQETNQESNQEETNQEQNVSEDSLISDFLKTRGIDDVSRIKFQDDNGNIEERNWNDLSREEQFNILNTPLDIPQETQQVIDNNNDLSEEELQLLNEIRQSNLTPSQYIQQISGQIVQEPMYKIDDLSDDEVYILDLESRVGELSDEEAVNALTLAKQNEELYKKQIEGIRKEYKEREEFESQQKQATEEQEQQEAFEIYKNNVINSIDNFNSIGNLDLNFSDSDKEELAEFMLSRDQSGNNYLYQALQDPETLVKAAWFILNGDEAFNNVSEYFINQIKLVSEKQYNKGLEDGKKGVSSRPSVVIQPKTNTQSHRSYTSIEDLDDDD